MMTAVPILTILLTAVALLFSGRTARRFNLPESTGAALSLCAIAAVVILAPNEWRIFAAGGEHGEYILTLAREIGLTGLFFLAGGRFNAKEALKTWRISLGVAASGAILLLIAALLLAASGTREIGAAVVAAAAVACASLWLPNSLSIGGERSAFDSALSTSAAALTGLSMAVLNLYAVFNGIGGKLYGSAYGAAVLYILVKLIVIFSYAYFMASRFLKRAENRVSATRIKIGYLLIAALIYLLAVSTVGRLSAIAWAFVAGAVLGDNEVGKDLFKENRPAATALFLSSVFLSILLQPHGRVMPSLLFLFPAVIIAAAVKFAAVRIGSRAAGASIADAKMIAAVTLASGETAMMFLGVGMSKWIIEADLYFGILLFALISTLLGSIIWSFAYSRGNRLALYGDEGIGRSPTNGKKRSAIAITAVLFLAIFASTARAQSVRANDADDPVAKAMKSVEAVVDSHASAAERAIAASRLVKESASARENGERDRAMEILSEADKIAAQPDRFERSFLIDESARSIAAERAALKPEMPQAANRLSSEDELLKAFPRSVIKRFNGYGNAMAQILEEESVPAALLSVAFVESGFNPMALSPKGARGIWQFMPATARRYGLPVGPNEDRRTHPEHSTRAAARYLRDLYEQFGDWKLALAAYNAGERRIQQIIDRTGIRNFDEMARRGYLPTETRNYVPAALAVWSLLGWTDVMAQSTNAPEKNKEQSRNGRFIVEALIRLNGSGASFAETTR